MASLASTNDEIDEVQNEDLDEEVAEAGDADDPDFNLDEEVAEASDADEPQPKHRRISSLVKIKEGEESEEESEPEYVPQKGVVYQILSPILNSESTNFFSEFLLLTCS